MSLHVVDFTEQSPSAVIHTALGSGILAAVMGWLPQVLALVAGFIGAAYYLISIWESKTVQHWINNRRMVSKSRKIARLKAKEKVIIAQLEALQVVRAARREAAARVDAASAEAAKLVVQEEVATDVARVPPPDK